MVKFKYNAWGFVTKNISANTIGKITTYNIISVLPGSIVSGYNEVFGINDKLLEIF